MKLKKNPRRKKKLEGRRKNVPHWYPIRSMETEDGPKRGGERACEAALFQTNTIRENNTEFFTSKS